LFACTVRRDRLSAINTEVHLALNAKEGSFAVKADLLLTLFTPERIFAFATGPVETDPFAVRRIANCERGALFYLQGVSGSVARW
jgi:hypothetical protein